MKKLSFPTVKLGNFICEVKEKVKNSGISQDDFTVYGVTNTDGITVTNNKASDDLGNYTVLRENQFAYNPYRVNVGSIGLSSPDTFGAVSPAYVVFETNGQISNEFLLYYLKSSLGINLIKWYGERGGVRSALRFSDLKKIDFPDVTLEQQNKLLTKIKKLDKSLCELYKNLSDDKLEILRQSVLQQAVEGKLCEQEPNDEPASVLLEKIKAEKERLIAEKKIKKQKPLPPINDEEKPFALPKGWEWCRLGEILYEAPRNGYSPPKVERETNTRVLTLTATTSGTLDLHHYKYIEDTISESSFLWIKQGDLLIQRSNSLDYVGTVCLCDETITGYIYPDLMMKANVSNEVDLHYIVYYLKSPFARQYFKDCATGTSNSMKKITQSVVSEIPVALPPINEQKQIVKKINELLALNQKMKQELLQAKKYASQLMESVLQEAFSVQETTTPAHVIEFHPDQTTPETELLAAARGKIREDTWEHLCKRALEIAGEES